MTHPCLEIVTYKTGDPGDADRQREAAVTRAQALPGFAGWLPLSDSQEPKERADVVVWTSREAAENAGKCVGTSDEFSPFRDTITKFGSMGHFMLPVGGLPFMQAGDGMELGRFRLRAGITEEALRAAHLRMTRTHLAQQPGWRGQRLLRMQDGTWCDIAFADSMEAAQTICASWNGNPACEAFLAMIEPVTMKFGSIV